MFLFRTYEYEYVSYIVFVQKIAQGANIKYDSQSTAFVKEPLKFSYKSY